MRCTLLTTLLIATTLVQSALAGRSIYDCRTTGLKTFFCACEARAEAAETDADAEVPVAAGHGCCGGGSSSASDAAPSVGSPRDASAIGHAGACTCCDVTTLRWVAVRPGATEEIPSPSLEPGFLADAEPATLHRTIYRTSPTRGPNRGCDPPIFLEVCSILL